MQITNLCSHYKVLHAARATKNFDSAACEIHIAPYLLNHTLHYIEIFCRAHSACSLKNRFAKRKINKTYNDGKQSIFAVNKIRIFCRQRFADAILKLKLS